MLINGRFYSEPEIQAHIANLEKQLEDAKNKPHQMVKKGYWTAENDRPKSVMYRCSVCGKIAHDRPYGAAKRYSKKECKLNYCPNCGARMKLRKE